MRDIGQLCWFVALVGGCNARVPLGDLGGSGSSNIGDGGKGGATFLAKGGSYGRDLEIGGGGNDGRGGVSAADDLEEQSGDAGRSCIGAPLDIQPICPDYPPIPGSPCDDVNENGFCTWQLEIDARHDYMSAGCYARVEGLVWSGSRTELPPSALDNAYSSCPKTPPEDASSRTGSDGIECWYPYSTCSAVVLVEGGRKVWACGEPVALRSTAPPPRAARRTCFPPAIDESKQVKDLSSLEATNWCLWSHETYPRRGNSELFAASYDPVPIPGQLQATSLCSASLSTANCVDNLRSRPCTATLEQIDDCVANIVQSKLSWPYWFGHGCAPLLTNETCTGVVVQPWLFDEPEEALQCVPQLQ